MVWNLWADHVLLYHLVIESPLDHPAALEESYWAPFLATVHSLYSGTVENSEMGLQELAEVQPEEEGLVVCR